MPLTPRDLQTFEAYKQAMRAAAGQIKLNTPFCIYSDVQIPDAKGALHTLKPFLVVGSAVNAITPLLKNLHGTKAVTASGVCSLQGTKICLVAKSGKVNYGQFQSQATAFKELLGGKEISPPSHDGGADQKPVPHPTKLTQAAAHWHGARTSVDTKINDLKQAVKAHYAKTHPGLLKEIEKNLLKIDAVLDKLDHKLADSLKAGAAASEAVRHGELRKTRAILDEYKRVVQSEKLIAHIDQNPFGVRTNLKQILTDSLKQAEQSMA